MEKRDDEIIFINIAKRLASGLDRTEIGVKGFRERIDREWMSRYALNRQLFMDEEVLGWQDELDMERLRRVISVFEGLEEFEYCDQLAKLLARLKTLCRPAGKVNLPVSSEVSIGD